jgi:UDP-glucose 4-epimerase
MSPNIDWSRAVNGIDALVHCAARVHVMKDDATDPLEAYREVNVSGTLNLARQAAQAGVRRFIFVSSIKVNGETTQLGQPFTAEDAPSPLDPYGVSKLEAEQGLRDIEAQTGMEVVIVRSPLVYGPGVKANFASMMRWVASGIPLPLGAIHNARSMVALDNLVDLFVTCLKHPAAAGQTFLVSDGEDVSTTELLRRTAQAMGKRAFLLPVPAFVLEWGAALLGKRDVAQRLCGSLQVDINKTRRLLGWTPPLTLEQGLKKALEGIKH